MSDCDSRVIADLNTLFLHIFVNYDHKFVNWRMPPKQSKAEIAKKQRVVEGKTFGLKSKNRSKNVQKYVHRHFNRTSSPNPMPQNSLRRKRRKKRKPERRN